jgi:hypothetical protein
MYERGKFESGGKIGLNQSLIYIYPFPPLTRIFLFLFNSVAEKTILTYKNGGDMGPPPQVNPTTTRLDFGKPQTQPFRSTPGSIDVCLRIYFKSSKVQKFFCSIHNPLPTFLDFRNGFKSNDDKTSSTFTSI